MAARDSKSWLSASAAARASGSGSVWGRINTGPGPLRASTSCSVLDELIGLRPAQERRQFFSGLRTHHRQHFVADLETGDSARDDQLSLANDARDHAILRQNQIPNQ